jgi:hypothetical protein
MPIARTNPSTVQATAAKTYDGWWLTSIQIGANSPLSSVDATIYMTAYNTVTGELSPLEQDRQTIIVPNVMSDAMAAKYPALPPAIAAMIAAVVQVGTALGKL